MTLDFAHETHLETRATRDPETPTVADVKRHHDARVTVADWVTATHPIPTHIGWAAPAGDGWVWIDTKGQGGTADTQHQAYEELLAAAMHDHTEWRAA